MLRNSLLLPKRSASSAASHAAAAASALTKAHVVGSTAVPLRTDTIGEAFDQTVKQYPNHLAVAVLDQLHPQLVKDPHAHAHFVPNGGGDQWSKFLADSTKLYARLTYGELATLVDQFANGLHQLGLRKGDRLGVWLPNTYHYLVAQIAAAKLGILLVTVNPAYRANEAQYAFRKVGMKALLIVPAIKSSNYLDILNGLFPELTAHRPDKPLKSKAVPSLEYIISIDSKEHAGLLPFHDLLVENPIDSKDLVSGHLHSSEGINIQFTSGTTGNPKGVLLSHSNILNNGYFVGEGIALTPNDRICTPVPLYHCFGLVMSNLAAMTHGSAVVYPAATFDPGATLAAVQTESCTALQGVPTMFISELNHKHFSSFKLNTLRTGIMAGSVCPVETMNNVIKKMHCSGMTICYGQTETSPVSFQSAISDSVELRCETVGQIHPHLEVKVTDEEGNTLPPGERGELCTKGYSVMLGYWDDPEKTAEAVDQDGFLRTGDLAVIDETGYCRIVGRIKDLIIRGGENISPREIEDVLFEHSSVLNASVVGVPDPKYGETVCAFILTKGTSSELPVIASNAQAVGIDCLESEPSSPHYDFAHVLNKHCQSKLAHYKIPRYWVFASELPMTVTGKIQKFIMRDQAIDLFNLQRRS